MYSRATLARGSKAVGQVATCPYPASSLGPTGSRFLPTSGRLGLRRLAAGWGCAARRLRLLGLLLSPFFHLSHYLGMVGPLDSLLFGLIEQIRVNVVTALRFGLGFLNRYAVGVGPGVLADAGYLPAYAHPWRAP